jgi:hypothetical protein
MNTRICYMYRDGSNYKFPGDFCVAGILRELDLKPYLDEGLYFIPQDVGMPALQPVGVFTYSEDDDHPWHEITNILPTRSDVPCAMTAGELLKLFEIASQRGWPGRLKDISW